jgi:hypothetical protein
MSAGPFYVFKVYPKAAGLGKNSRQRMRCDFTKRQKARNWCRNHRMELTEGSHYVIRDTSNGKDEIFTP